MGYSVSGPRRRRDALPRRRGRDAPILRTEFGFDSRVLPGPGRPPTRVVPPAPATADARRGVSNSPEVENRQRENRSLGASDSGIFRSKLSGAESRRIRRRKFNSPCRIGFSEFFESLAARLNLPTNHASDTRSFEFEKKLTRGMRVGIERARRAPPRPRRDRDFLPPRRLCDCETPRAERLARIRGGGRRRFLGAKIPVARLKEGDPFGICGGGPRTGFPQGVDGRAERDTTTYPKNPPPQGLYVVCMTSY